jgi:alkylhydroperoxidase/carboxymuconolactone decarboxylase family protein YurZ
MSSLTPRERELVSLVAVTGSTCVSCIEHQTPAPRKAHLTDAQMLQTVLMPDRACESPAAKKLDPEVDLMSQRTPVTDAHPPCCG